MRLAALLLLTLGACASTSEESARYFRAYSAALIEGGKLRTERAPADAPFTDEDLARNFIEIALYSEFNKDLEEEKTPTLLRKWRTPIRYALIGDQVTAKDRADMAALTQRLTAVTGLTITEATGENNFLIALLTEDERSEFNALMEDRLGEGFVAFPREWEKRPYADCIAQLFLTGDGAKGVGIALIKDEIQGLYRTACIHEEFVQALGLTNDSEDVRPSIFNDDQEFALLTEHDEFLLRILYDDRLTPGMSEDEVRPLLPAIIADLRGADT